MKITTVNGKEIKKDMLEELSPRIEDIRKWFEKQEFYKTDELCPDYFELIYSPECIKLIKSRVDLTMLTEINPEAVNWYDLIRQNEREVEDMSPEILEKRYEFEETGICEEHILVPTTPFKTAAGEFKVENCAICRQAWVTIGETTYQDDLLKLLRWIAYISIKQEQKEKNVKDIMNLLGLEEEKKQQIIVGDLMTTTNPSKELMEII